jgi:hypothetical protein
MEHHMSKQVTVVTVTLEDRPDGGLRVSSDTLPGLMLAGSNKHAICEAIAPAIRAIFETKGYKIVNVLPNTPIKDVMREPSPRTLDVTVVQQFVVEYQDAA